MDRRGPASNQLSLQVWKNVSRFQSYILFVFCFLYFLQTHGSNETTARKWKLANHQKHHQQVWTRHPWKYWLFFALHYKNTWCYLSFLRGLCIFFRAPAARVQSFVLVRGLCHHHVADDKVLQGLTAKKTQGWNKPAVKQCLSRFSPKLTKKKPTLLQPPHQSL